ASLAWIADVFRSRQGPIFRWEGGNGWDSRAACCPGTFDNSASGKSTVPSGLILFPPSAPNVETLGYSQASLRDEKPRSESLAFVGRFRDSLCAQTSKTQIGVLLQTALVIVEEAHGLGGFHAVGFDGFVHLGFHLALEFFFVVLN